MNMPVEEFPKSCLECFCMSVSIYFKSSTWSRLQTGGFTQHILILYCSTMDGYHFLGAHIMYNLPLTCP